MTIDFTGVSDEVEFNNVDSFGFGTTYVDNVSFVPEPASFSLFAFGLGAIYLMRRRGA
jgi:hypothetical protein